jgi:hypothetical protein
MLIIKFLRRKKKVLNYEPRAILLILGSDSNLLSKNEILCIFGCCI